MKRLKGLFVALVAVSLATPPAIAQSGFDRTELLSGAGAAIVAEQEAMASGVARSLQTASVAPEAAIQSGGAIVGPNIRVNAPQQPFPNGLLGRSETINVASADGRYQLAGWNDAQGFCAPVFGFGCTDQSPSGLSGYAYSTDYGQTWTDGGAPDPFGGVLSRGDPWLARGRNGWYFFANLAINQETGDSLGLGIWRGKFSGNSFSWTDVKTVDSPKNAVTPDSDFYDKESVTADNRGNVYVAVINFQELCGLPQFGFGQVEVWRSNDDGATWKGPAIAGPEAPDSVASCGFEGTLQQSPVVAIGQRGEVYVVWQYGPFFDEFGNTSAGAAIYFARSLNGGVSFEPPVKLADINSMRQNPPVGYSRSRINDHPRIDIARGGPYNGHIYVTYYSAVSPVAGVPITSQSLVSSQVYVISSDNRGKTWNAPVEVGGPVPATGLKRFWPVVTTYQSRDVNVTYYEILETNVTPDPTDIECSVSIGGGAFRRGTTSSVADVYVATSRDGAYSFEAPVKVTSAPTNWCRALSNIRPNFGDYIGAWQYGAHVVPVWADARVSGTAVDTFVADVQP